MHVPRTSFAETPFKGMSKRMTLRQISCERVAAPVPVVQLPKLDARGKISVAVVGTAPSNASIQIRSKALEGR